MKTSIRPIAIVLPQFHPVPENDEWWGKGFTEWTNVTKAKPFFKEHYQPHLPADLGFYDLRMAEAREAQAEMAKKYGIQGFCYYHYWFNGRRILERPVQEIFQSGKPDFPFMFCWANENWTRRWDGQEQELLLKQDYSPEDDIAHMESLIPYFKDERYIKVNGKPVFALYKPFLLPDANETAKRWRKVAAEHGLELYLCHMVSFVEPDYYEEFDAVIDFEPFGVRHTGNIYKPPYSYLKRIQYVLEDAKRALKGTYRLSLFDYESRYKSLKSVKEFPYKLFPTVTPNWDNSPRRGKKAHMILENSTPEKFNDWVKKVADDFDPYSKEENFLFINAWNEWAEGNHMEPDRKWGHGYLEAFYAAIKDRL